MILFHDRATPVFRLQMKLPDIVGAFDWSLLNGVKHRGLYLHTPPLAATSTSPFQDMPTTLPVCPTLCKIGKITVHAI